MRKDFFELLILKQQKQELQHILACNEKTEKFGLVLTEDDARELLAGRHETLRSCNRVEFGEGILPKLIEVFCDSAYMEQEEYADMLIKLQEVFYSYKNESEDKLTDDELLVFMKEQFDGVCYGSAEYLESTCLERFARAIRAGYREYTKSGGVGEYEQFSEEERWDKSLYLEAVAELFSWQ